ncbi:MULTISPECIES: efflux RND transporter periplasmic adaptor subunit [Acidobacteriaceae]|uniref:efflux RND transporter periplasmic adaptor subunit n=1 Tax=Acidobacteriaceae TaxID=204434 RepID=UPI00131B71BA|nr:MULTISPECIES: efflux RND transporter periplasmic adaptor subunit [Acidobacteriaceae]MDW5266526.1 efflux RND transporter periplasmic adaptor subunit [Edaphobacter sp.]
MSLTLNPRRILPLAVCATVCLFAGCKSAPPPVAAAPQAMPVKVSPVTLSPVANGDTYVATIKSRRSATMQPQVDGNLTRIFVKSGDAVKAGQLLMQIDPLKQVATVQQQQGTEAQKKAVYQYNQADVERQRKLYEAGVTSKQAYDQAVQAYQNSKGDFDSSTAQTDTAKQQLAYYQIRAPFAGIVGDIPVHLGDYVSATTMLTTVDENADLEAYIYIPTERSSQVKLGLPVDILDNDGNTIVKSKVSFLSPQVDNGLQSILVKAEIPRTAQRLRNQQLVKARITWNTTPAPVIPVLAVSLVGGQTFVFIAEPKGDGYIAHQIPVTVGETVDNTYPVISGLKPGDKVILSGLQFLQEGAPVKPLG